MPLNTIANADTLALVELLRTAPLGSTVTFSAMRDAIGRDARGVLPGARRIALRDFGAAFMAERGVGLRRLHATEAPEIGAAARRKIRRGTSRARQAMASLAENSNGLPPEIGRKMAAEMSALGLIAHIATDKAAAAVADSDTPAPTAKAAEMFLRHIGGVA